MNYEYIAKHIPHIAQVTDQLTRHIDRRTYAAIEANRAARTVVFAIDSQHHPTRSEIESKNRKSR